MQVLLINNVDRVGQKGQIIKVSEGFARNYLFRRNFAVPMTEGTERHLALMKSSWEKQDRKAREAANVLAEKIGKISIKITKKAGDKGRLFGSVTTSELAELIGREAGCEIDKKHILGDHLKEVGKHDVVVRLSGDVKATVQVLVMADEGAPASA